MSAQRKNKKKSGFSWIRIFLVLTLLFGTLTAGFAYWAIWMPNTKIDEPRVIFISPGFSYNELSELLESQEIIDNRTSFDLVSRAMQFPANIKAGRFEILPGMSNREMIIKLRAGIQDPVKVRFGSSPDLQKIAKEIARDLQFTAGDLYKLMRDQNFLENIGTDTNHVYSILIPETYFVFWDIEADDFMRRMKSEYDKFWTSERKEKAEKLGLDQEKVMTLASIVQAESYIREERPAIAGVYLNRLNKGMRLQADPTVIFANKAFGIRRVLNVHLEFDSPYNTYKYSGLPPGPINNPEPSSIEAVLNPKNHDYYYFCASADFSGKHHFSKTLAEHNRYAAKYRKAFVLNERKKKSKKAK